MDVPRRYPCRRCEERLPFLEPTCETCGHSQQWTFVAACESCGLPTDYLSGTCHHCEARCSPWRVVERVIDETGDALVVSREGVPRPTGEGYARHLGAVKWQWADYRRVRSDGTEFHVRIYLDHYEVHRDEVSAIEAPGLHAVRYGPRAVVAAGSSVLSGMAQSARYSSRVLQRSVRRPLSLISEDR